MKTDWSFPKQILLALAAVGCLGIPPLLKFGSIEIVRAAIAGMLLTTVNVLLGYAAIEYSIGKSTTTFFKFVIGGMGIRLLLVAAGLVIMIKACRFHAGSLVGSMAICYVLFLVLEIYYVQKKINTKHQN